MTEQPPTAHPVPGPAARDTARYDTDPDALAWARTRVQHQLDRLAALEERAVETGKTDLAHGLSMARRSTQQLLLGEGCVVGAFDERRPTMFAAGRAVPGDASDTVVPPTLATLRDLIAADPGAMTIGEALASARTVLAAHTRELADIAHAEGAALYDDMGQKAAAGAWYVRDRLRALADEFDRAAGGEQE